MAIKQWEVIKSVVEKENLVDRVGRVGEAMA